MWKYQFAPSLKGALVTLLPVVSTVVSGIVPADVVHSYE
jgi:hypothetical protein